MKKSTMRRYMRMKLPESDEPEPEKTADVQSTRCKKKSMLGHLMNHRNFRELLTQISRPIVMRENQVRSRMTGKRRYGHEQAHDASDGIVSRVVPWYSERASPMYTAIMNHKGQVIVQTLDHQVHSASASSFMAAESERDRAMHINSKTTQLKEALQVWMRQHPYLVSSSRKRGAHKCDPTQCRFINLIMNQWKGATGAEHVCITERATGARCCQYDGRHDAHKTLVQSMDNVYICTTYGDMHWCSDNCSYMTTDERKKQRYCPISGRHPQSDEFHDARMDILAARSSDHGEQKVMRRIWSSMVYNSESEVITMAEATTSWLSKLISCESMQDIHQLKAQAARYCAAERSVGCMMSIECDVWSMFCGDRHDIEQEAVMLSVENAMSTGRREYNRAMADSAVRSICSVQIITDFYARVRPRQLVASMNKTDAFNYVEHLSRRVYDIWNIVCAQCELNRRDFLKDVGVFAVPMLYVLSVGISFVAVSDVAAQNVLLHPERSLCHMLPPFDVACDLVNLTRKRGTSTIQTIKQTITNLCKADSSVIAKLNAQPDFIRMERFGDDSGRGAL